MFLGPPFLVILMWNPFHITFPRKRWSDVVGGVLNRVGKSVDYGNVVFTGVVYYGCALFVAIQAANAFWL